MDAAHFEKMLTSEVLFEGRVVTLTKDTALWKTERPPPARWSTTTAELHRALL